MSYISHKALFFYSKNGGMMVEINDYAEIPLILNNYMRVVYHISIILLTIFLIISLTLWLVGVKIKSEKAIKNGMRLSLSMLIILCSMFGIIVLIAKF